MSIDLPGHYELLRFTKIGIVYRPVGCFRVCVRRGFHCVCSTSARATLALTPVTGEYGILYHSISCEHLRSVTVASEDEWTMWEKESYEDRGERMRTALPTPAHAHTPATGGPGFKDGCQDHASTPARTALESA